MIGTYPDQRQIGANAVNPQRRRITVPLNKIRLTITKAVPTKPSALDAIPDLRPGPEVTRPNDGRTPYPGAKCSAWQPKLASTG